jgi:hypothetical protein
MDKKLSPQQEKEQRILQKMRDMGMTPMEDVKKQEPSSQPTSFTPQISKTESAIRGGAQGLMFGFPDEATAALERLVTGKPYEQALQESRQAYKQAQEANPITYTGSEIAGGVLPALIPGVGQAATGAKLGRLAAIGAGTGALSGLGYSEGQDVGQVAKDVVKGGILGGALPVLPAASRYALEKSKPIIDTGIKSVISAVTGKGSQYLEKLERNPEQIKRMERIFTETAPEEISKLSNQLADVATIDPFAKRALAYSRKSYKILDNAGDNIKIDRNQITDYLNNLSASKIKSTSKVDKYLANEYKKRTDDIIEKYPETLNGRDAKRLIQEIDKDRKILLPERGKQLDKFDSAEYRELNKLRTEIDRSLKSQSPEYAESMKPVAEATELSSLLDRFKVDTFQGRVGDPKLAKTYIDKKLASSKTGLADLRSENETLNKLEKELQRNKYNDIEGIDKLRNLTQTFNDLNLYKELQATGAIGSNLNNRIMGSGAALGSAMAGTPGTIAGTIAGALLSPKMEKEGGRIAQKLMEKSQGIRTPSLSPIPEATQRGFQIQQGAQRGLLDQFLTENAGEVRRRRDMKSKFQQDNQNRVGK